MSVRERLFFLFESGVLQTSSCSPARDDSSKEGGGRGGKRGERSFASSEEIGEDLRRLVCFSLKKGRKQKETSPTVELPSKRSRQDFRRRIFLRKVSSPRLSSSLPTSSASGFSGSFSLLGLSPLMSSLPRKSSFPLYWN